MLYRFQWRRGSASNWLVKNPILRDGEPGIESDTKRYKLGDGVTSWSDLPYYLDENGVMSLIEGWTAPGIGPEGPPGPPNELSVGNVTTAPAGGNASASIDGTSPHQTINFVIPRGDKGIKGDKGDSGPPNSLAVGNVQTLPAGSSASASISGAAPSQNLNLGIPAGDPGVIASATPPTRTDVIWLDTTEQPESSDRVAIGDELTESLTSGSAAHGVVPVADGVGGIDWDKISIENVSGLNDALLVEHIDRIASHNVLVAEFEAHESDTTNVHGIADMSQLETKSDSNQKIVNHLNAADPHPQYETSDEAAAKILAHNLATTNVHGIANTADIVPKSLYDPNTILKADVDNTPLALTVPASTLVGRGASGGISALAPADIRSGFDLARLSTVGNLLTPNQASVETDTTGVFGNGLGSIARITTDALHGTACVALTHPSGASAGVQTGTRGTTDPYRTLVTPGVVYTGTIAVKSAVRPIQVRLLWWNASGGNLGDTGANLKTSAAWEQRYVTGVAPAGTAYATLEAQTTSSGTAGDMSYFDNLGIWAGAGGEWAMPGTPITNLGTLVTHPNVDDVLVQRWDSGLGRWQRVYYDSGWRLIEFTIAGLFQTIIANTPRIRRINNTVILEVSTIVGTGSLVGTTAEPRINLPTGFKKPGVYSALSAFRCYPYNSAIWVHPNNSNSASALDFTISGGTWGSSTNMGAQIIWHTDEAIPTSLPGTLVSAAPA